MHLPGPSFQILCATLLIMVGCPLLAQDDGQADWTKTRDQWGQVLFCQLIYKMPEVKSRLYSFDIEHCDRAGQRMTDIVAEYKVQDQQALRTQAEQHAYRLTQNTTDPYLSVPACRDYCSELAKAGDGQDD